MDTKKVQFSFFIGLLLLVIVLTGKLFLPFLAPVALAFMVALIFRPVHRWFHRLFGQRRAVASLVTIVFIVIVVFLPLTFLVERLASESYNLYFDIREQGLGDLDRLTYYFIYPIQQVFPGFNPDIAGYVQSLVGAFADNIGTLFSQTASFVIQFLLGVISLFYILKDGPRFRKMLVELSPLADRYDVEIIGKLEDAVVSVVRGSLLTALVQGCFVALGFTIFGIGHPVLWGSVAAVAALLPGLGTSLVMIPAVLFLFVTGATGPAIGLAIWGVIAVGLIDNILLPFFVGKASKIHPLFILFAVLGGMFLFGFSGIFLGPIIVSLLFALLDIYRLIILDDKDKKLTTV
jgi:predicted PurR-regulated permease PerM